LALKEAEKMENTTLTARQETKLREIIAEYKDVPGALLPVLEKAQEARGYLPIEALEIIANGLELPLSKVAGTAGFYPSLSSEKYGRHVIRMCKSAPCHVNGAAGETRLILKNVGKSDPVSSKEYAVAGGYEGLKKAIAAPEAVIGAVSASGVRGRGGAGYPVDLKWKTVKESTADQKYVVCNAAEGEPGTGKDRVILSGDPHAVIEGMAICGVAVGADKGFIYLCAEYPQVRETLEKAVSDARTKGALGKGILDSKLDFDIEIRFGAGSYVCGEETGLLESIEGNRGEPRLRPPYPAVVGLWGRPSVINNVETLANIPVIMSIGADGYRKYGTQKCPGTKLFTLSGNIVNPGVYEFPMGVTMRRLFEEVGGGCPKGKKLKGIQVGGSAAGVFVTPEILDTALDMESCAAAGMSLGTGSLLFFDEDADVIELCRDCMEFYADESCGKCTPCHFGIKRIADILSGILSGKGSREDIEALGKLSDYISKHSLCGLGQAAPTPVLSALRNFRDDYVKACASS
jgi:NADH-quinone oxidoreductase subunit F